MPLINPYYFPQSKGERNYHIFYQLLAGASAELRKELHLDNCTTDDFHCVNQVIAMCGPPTPPFTHSPQRTLCTNQSGCTTLRDADDGEDFAALQNALNVMGFGAQQVTDTSGSAMAMLVANTLATAGPLALPMRWSAVAPVQCNLRASR